MKRKLLIVVLSLALLAGVAAIGIHVLHKDALAMQTYEVKVVEAVGGGFQGVEGVTVEFWWDFNGDGELKSPGKIKGGTTIRKAEF